MMIAGELEKHLLNTYVSKVCNEVTEAAKVDRNLDPKILAIHIADGYHAWIEKMVWSCSTDQYLTMAILYVRLMDSMYQLFCLSECAVMIMIEWLYSRFLPIYVATGKHQYVEIVLGMMEHFYMKLPPKILHLVRLNHTVPLYEGVDRDGTLMAFWAHDTIIDNN